MRSRAAESSLVILERSMQARSARTAFSSWVQQRASVSFIDRSGAGGETAHDNHADESGEEAGDLVETLHDLELVREVDQGGQGVVRDELSVSLMVSLG